MTEDGSRFKKQTMQLAFKTLSADEISLKLVAIRCLIRYSRRYKPEEMSQEFSQEMD
jgi:hypothetical protein